MGKRGRQKNLGKLGGSIAERDPIRGNVTGSGQRVVEGEKAPN